MKHVLVLAALLALAACSGKPEETQLHGDFEVQRLFTHEGCTAYRFRDSGRWVFYTNCNGSTQSSYTCGKRCTATDGVSTYYAPRPQ